MKLCAWTNEQKALSEDNVGCLRYHSVKMKETERAQALVSLWLDRSEGEREGKFAVMKFHSWLMINRPELLSERPGDSYQHLKSDLRNHIRPDQI